MERATGSRPRRQGVPVRRRGAQPRADPPAPRAAEAATGHGSIPEVEAALNELLDQYARALQFVETLPWLGRVPVRVEPHRAYQWWKPESWVFRPWRLVCRPLVRMYAQAHVASQLQQVLRQLRPGRGVLVTGSDASQLRQLRGQIRTVLDDSFSWARVRRFVTGLPAYSGLVSLISAWLLTAGPTRPGVGQLGPAAVQLGVLLVALGLFIGNPSIWIGYRPMRTLWAGGRADGAPYNLVAFVEHGRALHRLVLKWPGFPTTNLYQYEGETYSRLGWRRPRQLPVDLLVDFWLLAGIFLIPVLSVSLASSSWREVAATGWLAELPERVWFWVMVALLVGSVLSVAARVASNLVLYRRRTRQQTI